MDTITTWRIFAPQHADNAYSGEGARIHGGRWNNKGRALVYSSENLALAVLEQLVHLEDPSTLAAFVAVNAELNEKQIEILSQSSLPADWRAYPAPSSTKKLGDAWLSRNETLALRVPSVTVRGQYNHLVNPAHPDFAGVEISEPEPLGLDPRITNNSSCSRSWPS